MPLYDLRIATRAWGTSVIAPTKKAAIKRFLTDPIYKFRDGFYTIEIRGKGFFHVSMGTICTRKVEIRLPPRKNCAVCDINHRHKPVDSVD